MKQVAGILSMLLAIGCGVTKSPSIKSAAPDVEFVRQIGAPSDGAAQFIDGVRRYVAASIAANPEDAKYFGWGKTDSNIWILPVSWCTENLKLEKPVHECTMSEQANGRAAVFVATGECEEWCDIGSWIAIDERGPRQIPAASMDEFEVANIRIGSDLSFAFGGGVGMCGPEKFCATMKRLDLKTFHVVSWSQCGAPSLSPDEKWVVCRGVNGDVLRMPVTGGKFEIIFSFDRSVEIRKGPELGVQVMPVAFHAGRVIITTETNDGLREDSVSWDPVQK